MSKQIQVLNYLRQVPGASISDIYMNVSFGYYNNANKHLGALLSRMVKSGKIVRLKKGLFSIAGATGFKKVKHEPTQLKLF